jgi:choline dehydrogenase-like flavoprotein
MLHDDGGGRVWGNPFGREPVLTYRMSKRDKSRVPILLRRMAEIFFAAGAKDVFIPVLGSEPIQADAMESYAWDALPFKKLECSSQHPLGSCHMGASASDSVVDPSGRTWDVPNVWVADGSLLPTSLGVNPQLTIMAMATRVAFKMLERPKNSTRAR